MVTITTIKTLLRNHQQMQLAAEIYLQDYLTIYTNDARATTGTKILAGFPPYKNFIEEFDASACYKHRCSCYGLRF
jgi:hypothetical protein